MLNIRTATPNDLATITAIQAACYAPELVEHPAALSSKLQQAASSCWLAALENKAIADQAIEHNIVAYLITLPVNNATFPALNAPDFRLAHDANILYLHDLAVHPAYRATGAGHLLIAQAKHYAIEHGFSGLSLIAVQDSRTYWQKHGFIHIDPVPSDLQTKVASFGPDACLMQQNL